MGKFVLYRIASLFKENTYLLPAQLKSNFSERKSNNFETIFY